MDEGAKEIRARFGIVVQFSTGGQVQYPIKMNNLTTEDLKQVIFVLEETFKQLQNKVAEKESQVKNDIAHKIKFTFSQI